MSDTSNEPIAKIRDGRITATIWENEGENGAYYSITIARSYKDKNDNWKETNSFSPSELLKVQRLTGKAYDAVQELYASEQDDDEREAA